MTLGKAVWGNFCCSSKGHFSIHTAFSAENVSFSQLEDTFPAENTHSSYSNYCFSGIYLFVCLFSAHFSALFKSFCYATETEMENSSNHRKTHPTHHFNIFEPQLSFKLYTGQEWSASRAWNRDWLILNTTDFTFSQYHPQKMESSHHLTYVEQALQPSSS